MSKREEFKDELLELLELHEKIVLDRPRSEVFLPVYTEIVDRFINDWAPKKAKCDE